MPTFIRHYHHGETWMNQVPRTMNSTDIQVQCPAGKAILSRDIKPCSTTRRDLDKVESRLARSCSWKRDCPFTQPGINTVRKGLRLFCTSHLHLMHKHSSDQIPRRVRWGQDGLSREPPTLSSATVVIIHGCVVRLRLVPWSLRMQFKLLFYVISL